MDHLDETNKNIQIGVGYKIVNATKLHFNAYSSFLPKKITPPKLLFAPLGLVQPYFSNSFLPERMCYTYSLAKFRKLRTNLFVEQKSFCYLFHFRYKSVGDRFPCTHWKDPNRQPIHPCLISPPPIRQFWVHSRCNGGLNKERGGGFSPSLIQAPGITKIKGR